MRKNIKFLALFGVAVGLMAGGMMSNEVGTNASAQEVSAATINMSAAKKAGYTKSRVLKANQGRMSGSDKNKLIKGSMAGMKQNKWMDTDPSDRTRIVIVTNLSWNDKIELSHFTMGLINSARRQMGKKAWTYKKGALKFADRTAKQYYDNNRSCWDSDHYVPGIERAAKQSGLNSTVGQVYEDEAGLPITSEYNGQTRSMAALKNQIYFNVKQMIFGGYWGDDSQVNQASRYTEWQHAGDLLGLRSSQGFDAKTKYFGVSFSGLKNDQSKISVHMMGVAKRYIKNYKKFNR